MPTKRAIELHQMVNNDDKFIEWLDYEELMQRCPDVIPIIMEEYTNDWIEYCEEQYDGMSYHPSVDKIVDPDEEDDEEEDEVIQDGH